MSVEKTIEKIMCGDSNTNIRFEELCLLLGAKGFRMRISSGSSFFMRAGMIERLNIQREGSKAKPYQVRQVRKILAEYKLL